MNILNNQIGSIYDRQKNLYSKYPRYSQQNAESKKVCGQEKITATSGKDVLCITKGDKENSYIVHFSDSAMVSRAVARGYVTVNGADVEKQYNDAIKAYDHTGNGVSWSQFEWKTYDTQMTVTFEDSVKVEGISKGMNVING